MTNLMVHCSECMGEGVDYGQIDSDPCEECEGEGELEEVDCPVCEGDGCPRCFQEGKLYNLLCPVCEGVGEIDFHPKCSGCKGTGWRPNPECMTGT